MCIAWQTDARFGPVLQCKICLSGMTKKVLSTESQIVIVTHDYAVSSIRISSSMFISRAVSGIGGVVSDDGVARVPPLSLHLGGGT